MKLLILDRDGVINHDSDQYIKSPDEWVPIPGSLEAIACANDLGWTVAIATNQSGIARGFYDIATLNAMHEKMETLLAREGGRIAHIAFCPHLPTDECSCRKPLPGLLLQIKSALSLSAWPDDVWMVGDTLKDLQVGLSQSIPVSLVLTGKGEQTFRKLDSLDHTVPVFADLATFVEGSLKLSPKTVG